MDAMRAKGGERAFSAGDVIVPPGEPMSAFHYLLEGVIEAFDPTTDGRYGNAVLGKGKFTGDPGFMTGANAILGTRAITDGRLLTVPRAAMLRMMSDMPRCPISSSPFLPPAAACLRRKRRALP